MKRFQKILYIDDPAGSVHALQRVIRLARTNEAQLTITSLSEELPRSLVNLKESFLKSKEEEIRSYLGQLGAEDLDVQVRHLIGTPFLKVIKEVAHEGHDLIVKPAEGQGGLSDMLFGSTDLHLLRKCPCPVWIIKPTKRKKYARILAAVDPDPSEDSNAELNTLILDLATSLAQRENSELHIVHAWIMSYESMLRSGRSQLPKAEVDRMVRDTRKAHKKWLDALLGQYDLQAMQAKVHLVKGRPGDVIPDLARKKRVELIVMGTLARTGIPGFFIGNSAEKILAAVDCSVLAVKPQAFTTPVET